MFSGLNKGYEMNNSIMDKPATKQDIENLRYELISKMATKEELKKLATKDELKKLDKRIDNLTRAVGQMQNQITLLETKEDAERKFNIVINAIDGLARNVTDFQVEMRSSERTFQRHEDKLENHEKRIESLEMSM